MKAVFFFIGSAMLYAILSSVAMPAALVYGGSLLAGILVSAVV